MLDCRIFVENDTVVVFNACEFLISNFDLAIRKSVDLIFDKNQVILISLLIEKCGLNLGPRLVHQLNIQQTARGLHVLPVFLWVFFGDPRFNLPIEHECIERLNLGVVAVRYLELVWCRKLLNVFGVELMRFLDGNGQVDFPLKIGGLLQIAIVSARLANFLRKPREYQRRSFLEEHHPTDK
jgi:hypothetical protein